MSASRTTQRTNRPAYYFLGRSAMRWQAALDTRSSTSRRRNGKQTVK
jgi:hypothetical protein